jgi:NAD(P)-dependent dehydrogenase (short-subunit alcohol dehydrogenase family)
MVGAELADRVAVVTGAGSGLGLAVAHELAERGATVLVADVDGPRAEAVAHAITGRGGAAEACRVDVGNYPSVVGMVEAAARLGPLTIAVNNAGIAGEGVPVVEYSLEGWAQLMRINLDGVFHAMKAEIPAMVEAGGGSIVNMASVLGTVGRANASAYVAAKHAVVGLTKSAALECAADGIRVNAVAAGFVLTPLNESRLSTEQRAQLREEHALGRLGEAREIAAVVAFLASEASSFVTGSCQVVDGGYSAR